MPFSHSPLIRHQGHGRALVLTAILVLNTCGCSHVAGNYPTARVVSDRCTAKLVGRGFQLEAGAWLRVDKVEAELDNLRSQGFSRHDPQIVKSVARRNDVPPGLLIDRSGCAFYRMTAQLDPGVGLTLAPGALEMTIETENGVRIIRDQGYVLEDRRIPGGCRRPPAPDLALGSSDSVENLTAEFLVRLPVRGKISAVDLVPGRFRWLKE